jgi:hypothetical protein
MSSRPDVVLTYEERAALGELAVTRGHRRLADELGVGLSTVVRAISGMPLLRCSATALRHGIEALVDGPVRFRVGEARR